MRRLYSVALAITMLSGFSLFAQGEWEPEGVNFASPQHLMTLEEIPLIHQFAGEDEEAGMIYQTLWNDFSTLLPPTDTVSDSARQMNARYAKNSAFLLAIGFGRSQCQFFAIDQEMRDSLTSRLFTALSNINASISSESAQKWVTRARELNDYLAAIDIAPISLGIPITDPRLEAAREQVRLLAGNLYRRVGVSRPSIGSPWAIGDLHDHRGLIICGALGSAAITFHDEGDADTTLQPAAWMNLALSWSDQFLWQNLSSPDVISGFAEGPHYMREAYTSLLPFYRTLGRVLATDSIAAPFSGDPRTVRHPATDPRQDSLYSWVVGILNPDGTLPSIEETHVNEAFLELALKGNPSYVRELSFPETTCERSTWSASLISSSTDMRAEFLTARLTATSNGTEEYNTYFPHAGNIVLRSARAPEGWAIGLLAESGRPRSEGGERDQGDAGSFYIVQGNQPLSYDPGFHSEERRADFGSAGSHNMILVDGEGPGAGVAGESLDSDVEIESYFALHRPFQGPQDRANPISYTRLSTSYEGAEITRHVAMINGSYGVIADHITSSEPRSFTWQLHGYMPEATIDTIQGGFTLDSNEREAVWENGTEALSAHVAVRGDSISYTTRVSEHELGRGLSGPHNALLVNTTAPTRSMQFVAGLAPEGIGNDLMYDSDDGVAGATLVSRVNGRHDVFSLGEDTTYRTVTGFEAFLPYAIETDALFFGGHLSPFKDTPTFLFMCQGTTLNVDNIPMISADRRLDLALFNNIGDRWEEYPPGVGYVSDSGTVWISEMFFEWAEVFEGDNIERVVPLFGSGRFAITFSGPGYFWWDHSSSVEASDTPDGTLFIREVVQREEVLVVSLSETLAGVGSVDLAGSNGQVLRQVQIKAGDRKGVIGKEEIPSGTYFVVVRENEQIVDVEKIVVTK